jgi:hypothetical protein
MKIRYLKLLVSVLILTGCGTVDVTKRTDDTYTVSSQYGSLNGSWDRAAKEALDKATVYCEGRREKMLVVDERREGIYGISPQRVEIIFRCTIVDGLPKTATPITSIDDRLLSLKSLLDKKHISPEDYEKKKAEILKGL